MITLILSDRADDHRLSNSADRAAAVAKDWRRDHSSDVHNKKASFTAERDRLRESLQKEFHKLGKHASRHQAVSRFRIEHAEGLWLQQQRAAELTAEIKSSVDDSRPSEISEFRSQHAQASRERHDARRSYREQLASLNSIQAKEALRDNFREDQRERHRDLKDSLKTFRGEIRNNPSSGDRRIED